VAELPTGTVTFLFTDLESSTRLWEEQPDAMRSALARHDELLTGAIEHSGGHVIKGTGDGVHAVFATADAAVVAALEAQRSLEAERWGPIGSLRVRIGLHTGVAEQRGGDYFGPVLNRAARLMAVAHPGQVLCSHVTADLVRDSLPDGVGLLDLGVHGLRDLARPEEVFQVTHPDLGRDFPPLGSLDAAPGNLPAQRTNFIGREAELAKLTKLIEQSRVVTLTGAGGVGKTRLAVQSAASLVPHFDDGTWFVDLGPIDDGSLVAAAVASAMRLPDRRQGSPEDAILASARDSRALIVLDNCEHVIEPAARLAELVTDHCREVVIVATSREPLGVEGEQVLSVGPLPVPARNDTSTVVELYENESVRLFVERANAAQEGFTLTDADAAVIADVCRRLDGIPLALELAAARTQSMSPQSILERLDERFRLLSQGRRTALARHQTLRAAVDWSYDLLDSAERLAFARLSVFANGFTLEAAESVIANDQTDDVEVLDALSGLVAKSMVLLEKRGSTARYRLLETMREYAAERLPELDQPDRVAGRHADYYVVFAEEAARHIVGTDDSLWSRRLDAEHDNLHAALSWVRDRDPAKLTQLTNALTDFWFHQRHYQEGLGWITAALDLDREMSPRVRAGMAARAGHLAINLYLVTQGHEVLRQSLEASRAAGDEPDPYALQAFALGALVTNQPAEARRYSDEALKRAIAAHEPYVQAYCTAQNSIMISMTSDDPKALELADQALEMVRPLGNDFLLSIALEAAGVVRYLTDPTAAVALLDEVTIIAAGQVAVRDMAIFFKGIAHVSLRQYRSAAQAFGDALALNHAAGAQYYECMVIAAIAHLLARTDSAAAALRLLGSLQRLRDDGQIIGAPRDLAMQEQLRDHLRQTIKADEFGDLWAAGRRLTLDDAVSLARAELSQVS
jgi:predicted ATPase/class 3 adenylate cyclase